MVTVSLHAQRHHALYACARPRLTAQDTKRLSMHRACKGIASEGSSFIQPAAAATATPCLLQGGAQSAQRLRVAGSHLVRLVEAVICGHK